MVHQFPKLRVSERRNIAAQPAGKEKRGPGRPPKADPAMARPKGSKNKPKVGPFNPDKLQDEVDEVFKPENIIAKLPEVVVSERTVFDVIKINKRIKDPETETPYPSNWESLSKVDKLSWLTTHRKK